MGKVVLVCVCVVCLLTFNEMTPFYPSVKLEAVLLETVKLCWFSAHWEEKAAFGRELSCGHPTDISSYMLSYKAPWQDRVLFLLLCVHALNVLLLVFALLRLISLQLLFPKRFHGLSYGVGMIERASSVTEALLCSPCRWQRSQQHVQLSRSD